MSRKELLLIGIDGAIPDLVKLFSKKGVLPNITELIEKGVIAEAFPCVPCDTPGPPPRRTAPRAFTCTFLANPWTSAFPSGDAHSSHASAEQSTSGTQPRGTVTPPSS
ncbi:MAG: hypothetical protein ACTSRV_16915 [Candidatus Freyarchaeota archaeon]